MSDQKAKFCKAPLLVQINFDLSQTPVLTIHYPVELTENPELTQQNPDPDPLLAIL